MDKWDKSSMSGRRTSAMLRRRHSMAMRPKQGEGGVLELFGPRFYGDHGDEMTNFLGFDRDDV
jgi:hypothetical protein